MFGATPYQSNRRCPVGADHHASKHLKGKKNDVFVSLLSDAHEVTPRDSAHFGNCVNCLETDNPVKEVEEGLLCLEMLRYDSTMYKTRTSRLPMARKTTYL